jgi:hypothetical protein
MGMKEYGSCQKFGRGDNLTYTLKYVLYGEMDVELSPLPNFGQRSYFFRHICR